MHGDIAVEVARALYPSANNLDRVPPERIERDSRVMTGLFTVSGPHQSREGSECIVTVGVRPTGPGAADVQLADTGL